MSADAQRPEKLNTLGAGVTRIVHCLTWVLGVKLASLARAVHAFDP